MKKIILTIALCIVSILLQKAFAQNYIAQPSYREGKIRFYAQASPINPATVAYTLDVAAGMNTAWGVAPDYRNGPNAVLIYNNKLFVSFDLDLQKGGVLVYNMLDITAAPTAIKPGGGVGKACAGMAIQPSTGNLYIATYCGGATGADGGIYYSTAASGYTNNTLFAGFNNSPAIDYYTANLAFDSANNLWATTWSGAANATQVFLVCFKNTNSNAYYKITNTATNSYTATSTGAVSINVHLWSRPEGLVRDATGNLWVGNNNDYAPINNAGEGTLVKITNAWITSLLAQPAGTTTTIPAAVANVSVYYIPNGKLGGMTISGNTLYINDQGQNQGSDYLVNGTVWRYDVTSTFNTANFKVSGIRATYPGNGQMGISATLPITAAPPTKLYVKADATGLNNGTSWANAYTTIQDALNNPNNIDTFFVAQGTYKAYGSPIGCTNCNSTRFITFALSNNVKLFGGFAGTERWLTQRVLTTPSKISGDTDADGTSANNAYHLFFLVGVTGVEIDGFSLEGGNADNGCADMMVNNNPYNLGNGGAIYSDQSTFTVRNSTFKNNNNAKCNNGLGGRGGAVYSYWSTITYSNCLFFANYSANAGGAMYNEGQAVPLIYNCVFDNNYASGGGGAICNDYANGYIKNCVFNNNNAVNGGGALSLYYDYGTIENSVFYNNGVNATNTGGGHGGAIYTAEMDGKAIRNCTFYNNHADQSTSEGAAIYSGSNEGQTAGSLTNCIFWNNTTPNNSSDNGREEIYSTNTGLFPQTTMKNCISRTGLTNSNILDGGNNKIGSSFDPQFTNAANPIGADNKWATVDDGLHPTCVVSPALNNATPTSAPLTDIKDATRQGVLDIGAYEAPCGSPAIFVSNSSTCQTIVQNAVTGNNWFHFSNGSGIVCSINPQGQNLGNVTAKVADPTGIVVNGATRYLGRSVNLTSTIAPTTDYLLRIYYKDTEITEYQNATGQNGLTPNSFNVLWSSGGTGCGANNFYGTTGGVVPAQHGVATGEFGASNEGFYLQVALNHFTLFAASTDAENTLVGTENQDIAYANAVIYPNPTTNDIRIDIENATNDRFQVQVFDMTGRTMTQLLPIQNNTATVAMQDMPYGIYNLVIIQNDKVVMSKRVVKM